MTVAGFYIGFYATAIFLGLVLGGAFSRHPGDDY
jgi:hypothetical protein